MKRSRIFVFLCSVLSSLAFAGQEGGGGVAVRCGNSLELLEVHEARLAGVKLRASPANEMEAITMVSGLTGKAFWTPEFDSLEEYIAFGQGAIVEPMFQGREFFASRDGEIVMTPVIYVDNLPLANDIGSYQIAPGCRLEQVAYYTDGPATNLKIKKSGWAELDWLSRSFLVAHEFLYASQRQNLSLADISTGGLRKTSEWTRQYLINLFSADGVVGHSDGIPANGGYFECTSSYDPSYKNWTRFFLVDTANGLSFIIQDIQGVSDLYQLSSSISSLPLKELLDVKNGEGIAEAEIYYSGFGKTNFWISVQKEKGKNFSLRLIERKDATSIQVGEEQTIECSAY